MCQLRAICFVILCSLICVQSRRILLGTVPILSGTTYNYQSKDWASVISTCRSLGNYERRIMNFYVRSTFHDSLTVIPNSCAPGACPGNDASVYLTTEDLRSENDFKNFTYISGQTAIQIANLYNVSVADTMAVCAAVAVQFLGGPNIIQTGQLRVGRLDSETLAPINLLPASTINATQFISFFSGLNFTSDDMAALIGAHSLIAQQGCFQGQPATYCDPSAGSCTNIKMFTWDVHYYQDICTPSITINPILANQTSVSVPVTSSNVASVSSSHKCQWTSALFQNQVQANINQELATGGSRPSSDVVNVDWASTCPTGRRMQEGSTDPHHFRKLLQGKPGQANPPKPAAASNPPQPVGTSLPPKPAAPSNPPQAIGVSLPPKPAAPSNPPQLADTNLPPKPAAPSNPPQPVAASLPPKPAAASNPPQPVATSLPPKPVAASPPSPPPPPNSPPSPHPPKSPPPSPPSPSPRPAGKKKPPPPTSVLSPSPSPVINSPPPSPVAVRAPPPPISPVVDGQPTGCPHIATWFYTRNDAYLGQVCQGIFPTSPPTNSLLNLQGSLRKYMSQGPWDHDFTNAYLKMVNVYANFAPGTPYSISGQECPSGFIPGTNTCSTAITDVSPLLSTLNMTALNI